MSSKTRTRKPRTTATAAPALRSVPDQPAAATVRTDAEDKLWEALHAKPNSTAADLSAAAVIGKSTAQKILVKWEGDGSVTRSVTRVGFGEGGRRAADLWAIADTTDATPDGTDTSTDGTPADEATVEDLAPTQAVRDARTIVASPDRANTADATSAEEYLSESATAESVDPASEGAQDTSDATVDTAVEAVPKDVQDTTADAVCEEPGPAAAEPATTEAAGTGDGGMTLEDATETASGDGTDGKSERLAPGALRGMVEDWLREHPGEQASPTKIAKDLGGKSSGAVSNALDKLVADGTAVKTQDKPRRFALAPAKQAATAPAN